MRPPRVSVIIGAYNCEEFIEETVRSVMDQTFKDWELIVVDDCSTDRTGEKAAAMNDGRIKIIKLENNSGRPAVPRNTGIRIARGEYVSFLDHDDIWLPEKLAKQVAFMDANPDVFLLYSKCFVRKGADITEIAPANPKKGHIFNDLYLEYNLLPCSTVMMRNSRGSGLYFFNEDSELKAIEDYDLWLSIAYRNKISFIDEPLAIYRLHSKNTSYGVFPFFNRVGIIMKKYGHLVPRSVLARKYISFYYLWLKNYAKFKIGRVKDEV